MEQPLIDRTVYAALEERVGADFAAELVDTFVEEGAGILAELRAAHSAGDAARFRRAAHSLKSNGEISEIVRTQYGFHIIQLEERRDGDQRPFDQVKEQIRATLRNEAMQDKTKAYYDQLKQAANLQIDDKVAEHVAASIPEPSPGAAPVMPVHGGH